MNVEGLRSLSASLKQMDDDDELRDHFKLSEWGERLLQSADYSYSSLKGRLASVDSKDTG